MSTSIVIPIFNESGCLAENLAVVFDFLRNAFDHPFEVVCVDDGSTDKSLDILNGLKNEFGLKICTHQKNRGKGAAVRTGMLATGGDLVFFFDADLSTPLDEMHRFFPLFDQGAEVVIGTRKSSSARITKFQPLHRVIMGMGYTHLVNFILGMKLSDFTCGFKGFSRKAVDTIF
ncbi:MAG: glycosyltransferase family 2 protein, partial [Planctomycetes bacterium]|nr:glycosyltransferase family 2 protein [Planctomycetota bacterium]